MGARHTATVDERPRRDTSTERLRVQPATEQNRALSLRCPDSVSGLLTLGLFDPMRVVEVRSTSGTELVGAGDRLAACIAVLESVLVFLLVGHFCLPGRRSACRVWCDKAPAFGWPRLNSDTQEHSRTGIIEGHLIAISGRLPGSSHRSSLITSVWAIETQPDVGTPRLTCRKMAEPAPRTTGNRL
jgi:hypothetical protein